METDLFQSCSHCWVFQICWHIECSTFTASSLRIWNSSTGIPSPPLALLIVMLLQAHLTLHSRMFGFRWVSTPSWLSGSWRSFLYSSSVYSCHPFFISSASVRSIPFLSVIVLIFAWNVTLVSLIFLKLSLVFLYFFVLHSVTNLLNPKIIWSPRTDWLNSSSLTTGKRKEWKLEGSWKIQQNETIFFCFLTETRFFVFLSFGVYFVLVFLIITGTQICWFLLLEFWQLVLLTSTLDTQYWENMSNQWNFL